MHAAQFASRKRSLGADVAASIREFFGANFTHYLARLKAKGIQHSAVAKVMGVPLKRIATYKKGVIPDPEKLNAFCDAYGIQTDDLFVDPDRRDLKVRPSAKLIAAARELLEAEGFKVITPKH